MQTYTQTVAAGSVFSLNIAGRYFRILEAPNGPVDVIFYRHGGVSGNAEKVGPGYWSKPKEFFSRVDIYSETAQKIKIAVADGDGGYDVVGVTGVVSVSDAAYQKVIDNKVFSVVTGIGNAVVGQLAIHCLWNPAGSGKKIAIRRASLQGTGASSSDLIFGTASLQVVAGANPSPKSLLASGADSAFRVYSGNAVGSSANKQFRVFSGVAANASALLDTVFPVVIDEGKSFIAYCNNQNTGLGPLTLDWEEVPN